VAVRREAAMRVVSRGFMGSDFSFKKISDYCFMQFVNGCTQVDLPLSRPLQHDRCCHSTLLRMAAMIESFADEGGQ